MENHEREKGVAELISGLSRVDAPPGFEKRVLSRIAERHRDSAPRRPAFFLFLKFAAPAAALLLMGALLFVLNDQEVHTVLVPPVQDSPNANTVAGGAGHPNAASFPGEISPTAPSARSQGSTVVRQSKENAPSRSGISSEDIAVDGPGETLTPPGLDPRPRRIDPSAAAPGGVKASEMLSFIGANTSCGADGCRVTFIRGGSLADRALLNVGDRIVAIDGRSVSGSTSFVGPTGFRILEVVRDGRTITLALRPN